MTENTEHCAPFCQPAIPFLAEDDLGRHEPTYNKSQLGNLMFVLLTPPLSALSKLSNGAFQCISS